MRGRFGDFDFDTNLPICLRMNPIPHQLKSACLVVLLFLLKSCRVLNVGVLHEHEHEHYRSPPLLAKPKAVASDIIAFVSLLGANMSMPNHG